MTNLPYNELSRSIAGKTAFITGASSGMGRATAHLFAREGANVAVTDRDADGVATVVAESETPLVLRMSTAGHSMSPIKARSRKSSIWRLNISVGWRF